jgi:thiol-disulfide isomerase/thioredoxin
MIDGRGRMRPVRLGVLAAILCGLMLHGLAGSARAAPASGGLDLSPYKGRVVYLDFWASWCGPCKLSFPYMQTMTSRYAGSDFVVLAVNLDHDRANADAFLKQVGSRLTVVYDPAGTIARGYAVREMPSSVLIGRDGKVRYVHKGFFLAQTKQYEAHIVELIGEKG